jgi:DNA polymerase III delta prime subunit
MSPIWSERYRPAFWESFVSQDDLRAELQAIAEGNAPMQHFLFHSPEPGTGKTSAARLLADSLGYTLHTFNASSKRTRGIEFVEEDIMPLARSGRWETIILLDEADRLTIQAQDALKGVIENATCYFILTCNDLSLVRPWLQSRAQVRTFAPHSDESMGERLRAVALYEAVNVSETHMAAIIRKHRGDLRNAIGCLQAYASLPAHGKERESFIMGLGEGDFDVRGFMVLCAKERAVDLAVKKTEGLQIRSLIHQVFDYVVESDASPASKMRVVEACIISERDVLMGVHAQIVRWNLCRLIAGREGFNRTTQHGENNAAANNEART